MSFVSAIGRRLGLSALLALALSLSGRADELADFHAAVEEATAEYRVAMAILETSSQSETSAAVQRFRQSWQSLNARFVKPAPAPFADDPDYPTMFMQVDVQLIGVLLTIDMGNRDAARNGLVPIGETLARLSARSAPGAQ
jgi:hypothetical protein